MNIKSSDKCQLQHIFHFLVRVVWVDAAVSEFVKDGKCEDKNQECVDISILKYLINFFGP